MVFKSVDRMPRKRSRIEVSNTVSGDLAGHSSIDKQVDGNAGLKTVHPCDKRD